MFSAELGDYDSSRHSPGYVSEFRFLANQTEDTEQGIEESHSRLVGLVPSQAENRYLEKVKWLDMYGVDLHPVIVGVHSISNCFPHSLHFTGRRQYRVFSWTDTKWHYCAEEQK